MAAIKMQISGTRRRARPNPIWDPRQPLAGRSLKRAANVLTNLQLRPQVSALSRMIANINRQGAAVQGRVGDYYGQLGQFGQTAVQAQRDATDRLNQMLARLSGDTQTQIGQFGADAQNALRASADRGLDGGAWAMLAREVEAQKADAAKQAQNMGALAALTGGNQESLAAQIMAADAMRGREQLTQVANAFAQAAAEPQAQKAELLASRGDIFTRNLGALRDSEREYMMGLEALGLDRARLQLDRDRLRSEERRAKRERQLQVRLRRIEQEAARAAGSMEAAAFAGQYGVTPDEFLAMTPQERLRWMRQWRGGGGNRGSWADPREQRKYRDAFNHAVSVVKSMRGVLDPRTGRPPADADIRAVITDSFKSQVPGGGYSDLVDAAFEYASTGRLSRRGVNTFHKYGIKVRPYYKVASRKAARKGSKFGGAKARGRVGIENR